MNFCAIHWASAEIVQYSFFLVALIGLLIYQGARVKRTAALLSVPNHARLVLKNFSWPRTLFKMILMSIGLLFLFLALARPQWDKKEQLIPQQGRDLFIALDISRSMLATDCKPNRLECAKKKIKLLLNLLSFERVGLIPFSGSSFIQCPLTSDFGACQLFLDQIDVETISSGTTALDQAVAVALDAFKAVPDRKNKLLAIFTDGEDFSSNLSQVKQEAQRAGLHIFTIGVGTQEGAPIPLFDDLGKQKGHQKDKKGAVVISRINEGILSSLAHDSAGAFIRITSDDSDMRDLKKKIVSYEKEKLDDKKVSQYQEQYPYFLGVSFVCFILDWIL